MRTLQRHALALVACTLAGAAPVLADEAHPPGTVRGGVPPLRPRTPTDTTWHVEARALGRARRGTVTGGDLLYGVAWQEAQAQARDDPSGADAARWHAVAAAWSEAVAAYPPDDVYVGLARIEQGEALLRAGALEAARDVAYGVARFRPRPPVDADAAAASRYRRGLARLPRRRVDFVVRACAAFGEFGRVAEAHEAFARDPAVPADDGERAQRWADAARAWMLAGERTRALRAIETARLTARAEAQVLRLARWELLARHDLLAEGGVARVFDRWPADPFAAEVEGLLATADPLPEVTGTLLFFASSAYASGRIDLALGYYGRAFRHPRVIEAVRADPVVLDGLLVGVGLALRERRLALARAWLATARDLAGGRHATLDALGADVRLAEHEAAVATVPRPSDARSSPPSTRKRPERIALTPDPGPPPSTAIPSRRRKGQDVCPLWWAGACLLVLLGILAWRAATLRR